MSNSVAELVANCFNVSGVGGENPEKWKAVTAVSALEAKLEAMKRLVVFAQHDYRCEARNGVESCACGYDNALAAAQQEKEDE